MRQKFSKRKQHLISKRMRTLTSTIHLKIEQTLNALSETFIPSSKEKDLPFSETIVKVMDKNLPIDLLFKIKLVLFLMTTSLGALLLSFTVYKPFHLQSVKEREAFLRSWSSSRLSLFRGLFKAFKNIVGLSYYGNGDEKVWADIKYSVPKFEEKSIKKSSLVFENEDVGLYECDGNQNIV